ncbi:CvfB family protein [Kushneria aurantia]|uniref:S1 RNA-binding domain-containing protein n=1 Tax=Kushneria aurantia TaxID=504092 RepID=A0ABV6G614_9GAMM|nr:S1-like domain-containing RNA-binding protein [Kushneria aurantia]
MAAMGRFNRLEIKRRADFGLYLDGGTLGDILLPSRYVPRDADTAPGDHLEVFVYLDSEDRPIATTRKPRVQVGEFARLKVVARTPVGVFLDWGLPKDLLLPHSEERAQRPLQAGDSCLVHVYLDSRTHRITASMRLDRHLSREAPAYRAGEAVSLLITGPTDLGFNAIINHRHRGLLHRSEVSRAPATGARIKGYVRRVRPDGGIDLSLTPTHEQIAESLEEQIMAALRDNDGELALSDRSDPALIRETFGVSKGSFKKALGGLYKRGAIVIEAERIRLA